MPYHVLCSVGDAAAFAAVHKAEKRAVESHGVAGRQLSEHFSFSSMALGQFQLFQLDLVAPNLRQIVLRLLHKPAFFGAAENLR